MIIDLNITLQPKQSEALDQSEIIPVLFYGGAKGGGKSYLVRAHEVYRRTKYPGSKGLIVRKTYPELLSNHIRKFFEEYPETVKWYRAGEHAIYWPNGSLTEFSHLASTNDVYSYQGREYDDIKIDEITQHEEEVFKILRSSLRTTNPEIKPRILLTGNPGGVGHAWVKRIFIDRQFKKEENPDDFGFVQSKVWDNKALLDADPQYAERLKDLPEDKRRAYLEGDWTIFSGQVYSEFRLDKHRISPVTPKSEFPTFLSFDWGYAAPFAAYAHSLVDLKTVDGVAFKRLITWFEWYGVEKAPGVWAEIIFKDLNKRRISQSFCDPSMLNRKSDGSRPIAAEFEERWTELNGGFWTSLEGGSRDRLKRIVLTHRWLSQAPDGLPYWLITDSCPNLIRTLPMLVYDEHKVEDLDSSQEDHSYDSVSYLLGSLTYVPQFVGGMAHDKVQANIITHIDLEGRDDATQFKELSEAFENAV